MGILDRFNLFQSQKHTAQRTALLDEGATLIPWLSPGRTLNPNLDTGTDRPEWSELHDALRDPKAAACLDIRCQIVSTLPWILEGRPGTPQPAIDVVREALEGLNLVEDLEELAKAAYYGLIPVEVHWAYKGGKLLPVDLESFDPFYLAFGTERQPMVQGRELPVGKLLLHRHGSHFRNPWGLGRGRTIPRWVRVKAAVAYSTYRDYPRYSHDRLHLTYPSDAGDAEQARYVAIARQLIDSPGMVTPDGMEAKGIRLDSAFEVGTKLIDSANAEIAVGILGNTLTTGEGKHGTQALGSVHADQSERQESADAKRIAATLNRTLIPWIVALNFGPDVVPPVFAFEQEISAPLKERLEAALSFKKEGLDLSSIWLRKTFGIPAPLDEADVLEAPEVLSKPAPGLSQGPDPKTKPDATPDPESIPAQFSADEPLESMFLLWSDGYLQRAKATSRLLIQALVEARDYPHALEAVLGAGRDFPASAALWLTDCLQAARDFGGFEVDQEVQALALEAGIHLDAPQVDYAQTPDLALRWLQGKVPMSLKHSDGLKDPELRARAFWMAGVDQMETIQALQQGMADALAKGTPFEAFRDAWLPRLDGISAGRLQTAFDLQLHQAYMGGRMATLRNAQAVENLIYVTAGDESVRPGHRVLNGVVRPKGDDFWNTHTPPLGWRCRCRIRAASRQEVVTQSHDPRLSTPPETGFGLGAPGFNSYLDSVSRTPSPTWTPVDPARQGWDWLQASRPARPMTPHLSPVESLPGPLVADPTGRVIAAPGAGSSVQAAIQNPDEVWLVPVEAPGGELGLEIDYLRTEPDGTPFRVSVHGGVVNRLGGASPTPDPSPYRLGVRLL